jgi:hypothetical protein
MLMNNYYEKYEQERLEKAAEVATRMEQNPEAIEAEVSLFTTYASNNNTL